MRQLLTSRRARITPQQAGLPVVGRRRVPGLRRSEVATLAGVSIEYDARLERGQLAGASASLLEAIARPAPGRRRVRAPVRPWRGPRTAAACSAPVREGKPWRVHAGLQGVLDAMRDAPAIVTNGRADLLASNGLGRALDSDLSAQAGGRPNFARFTFLHDAARRFNPDWNFIADITVANLRTEAGRDPHDRQLHELVGELSTRSQEFRSRWSAHDVRIHAEGTKHFRHPWRATWCSPAGPSTCAPNRGFP